MQKLTIATLGIALLTLASLVKAQALLGSRASMERQYQEAKRLNYTFVRTAGDVPKQINAGQLVKVEPNRHFELHQVSYPYAVPAVKLFIERLATLYHAECGEKLTVTSLTRPMDRQPANAARDSVHPTGMAVDLRIPSKPRCRNWLEQTLLSLEGADVLDVTRERNPPHYHVAVFPETYLLFADAEVGGSREYVVRKGDTLGAIARRTGVTLPQLRAANGLRGDLINVGQKLIIPGPGKDNAPSLELAVADLPVKAELVDAAVVAEPQVITHKVKKGETLWRIAQRYGTTVNLLRAENGLKDDVLQVGRVLRIAKASSS